MSDRNHLSRRCFRTVTARGGVTFKRRADGAVEIWLEGEYQPRGIVPANEWASTVTSLTTHGEDGFTWGLFMAFHNGGNAHDPRAYEHEADAG
jgi:hypothetical protein